MAYKQMAYLYDKLMEDAPYDQWINFTLDVFRNSGERIERIADLGCGTGEITLKLAKSGHQVTGVDYSTEMLAYAAHKANQQKTTVQWLQQDLRELQGLADFDAVVSFCDVINYITSEDELRNVFKRIADSLKTGGLFLFDVHSMFHVQHHFINQTFADVTEEASYIWFCIEGEKPGEIFHDLTFFSLEGNNYNRFDEYHHQRTYSIDFYQQLLIEAGFEKPKVVADFSAKEESLHDQAERIFFIAKKRSG
ncbi:SAM-dependent methyltransferase [Virgibacillus profundi]|uniref:SAM-dependent methyltransferase n=1 Tax=Virgibacillus profundi TaxID=2024555 RepID=A0A2A2ICG5_9BACI|nr:class I SAM-dependent methyltransferase [Virgibacillus profundi]PAV28996.1 SAM-dependent methyltransferase [Virgibacillus profundi]PXY53164.1 class I SAM-dependent methyltransferase [Virgibacillus profundi]